MMSISFLPGPHWVPRRRRVQVKRGPHLMQRPQFHPPRAPPDSLRRQSFQILSRLERIEQFRPWLELTRYHVRRRRYTPLNLLWDCFAYGAPLGTLLNLLGSPAPSHLVENVEEFDFELPPELREKYFESFIQRMEMLEGQGRLPYGEVLRPEEFLSSSANCFAKVRPDLVQRATREAHRIIPGSAHCVSIIICTAASLSRNLRFSARFANTEERACG